MLNPDSGGRDPETETGCTVLVNTSEIVTHLSTSFVVPDVKSNGVGLDVLVVLPTSAVMVKVPAIGSTLVAVTETGQETWPPAGTGLGQVKEVSVQVPPFWHTLAVALVNTAAVAEGLTSVAVVVREEVLLDRVCVAVIV
jgi:hypothetical protein